MRVFQQVRDFFLLVALVITRDFRSLQLHGTAGAREGL